MSATMAAALRGMQVDCPSGAEAFLARQIDPILFPPDRTLLASWRAERCLKEGILPWRKIGGRTVILDSGHSDFDRLRPELESTYGPVLQAVCARPRLQTAIERNAQTALVERAETRTAAHESSRIFSATRFRNFALALLTALAAAILIAPVGTIAALCGVAMLFALLGITMKSVATLAMLRHGPPKPAPPLTDEADLPVITILAPLHREANIADHLLKRLSRLNYPRDKLQLCLVVEQEDLCTRSAIAAMDDLPWVTPIIVPPGSCTTKPRAMNYALDFVEGEIIGIYDAEDCPDPQQLLTVARHFAVAPPDVVCLQGVLDYYNAHSNWLARCFTLEYAGWFRVVLPGFEKLGLVLPLGGTTLFFRRNILEELGAWDAQNVTEDADLGIRLARRGYRTRMIPTVTYEEANARIWPWIKQRSRWLKGYAITYAVHMRDPLRLLRDLGVKRFLGLQLQFAGTLVSFTLLPLLWSLWLGVAGLPHPLFEALPRTAMYLLSAAFILSEAINVAVLSWGAALAGNRTLIRWSPTLTFYFPLATVAIFKAFWEMAHKPFYWDKTVHGIFVPGKDDS